MTNDELGRKFGEIFEEDKRAASRGARDAALQQVEENADPEWIERASEALRLFLTHHKTMFVDDFWEWTELDRPRESRALGPVFVRAARIGLMEKSGGYRNSIASRMGPKPIWRSKIYDPNAAATRPGAQGELFDQKPPRMTDNQF